MRSNKNDECLQYKFMIEILIPNYKNYKKEGELRMRIFNSETKQNLKIDIRSSESLYITLNGWVYYIDDSTDEQIIEKWEEEWKI